jgi:hypothetical protein
MNKVENAKRAREYYLVAKANKKDLAERLVAAAYRSNRLGL